MSSRLAASIVVDGTAAEVRAPYDVRDVVKALPGRRWHPTLKCWLIGSSFAEAMAEALRAAGCTVVVTRRGGAERGGLDDDQHVVGAGWADALFAAVGPGRDDAVYRALSRVLHPDHGGDPQLQQALNVARDRLRRGAA